MKATLEEETETLVHLAVMVVTKPASIAKSPDISPEIAASAVDLVADHSSKWSIFDFILNFCYF